LSIVTRFFPNGEFSQGVDTSHKRRDKRTHPLEGYEKNNLESGRVSLRFIGRNAEIPQSTLDSVSRRRYRSSNGYTYEVVEATQLSCVLRWETDDNVSHTTSIPVNFIRLQKEWGLVPLVHQSVETCDKLPSRKKLVKMTKNMSRNIRNAVYLLEQQPGGKDVLSFLTLTLPDLSSDGLNSCCQNWDKMVKQFFDWLRVTLKRKHIELQHVYCTEIQLKRLQSRNEYAPHLHVVFKGRNGKRSPWAVTPKQCRKAWKRCIAAFVDEHFDDRALENLQCIKRSASRYLSKYLSKGVSEDTNDTVSALYASLRTQWGGMARSLSKAVRQATTRLDSTGVFRDALSFFVSNLEGLLAEGYLSYFKRGFIPLNKSESDGTERGLHVSCGCLSTATYYGGVASLLTFIESFS
jgi:hypothetical protein